jgi:hypothetical protein
MPPKKPAPRSDELFRSQLDNMIDMGCRSACKIDPV